MTKCPYCAEDIQDDAIVCKHCGRELDPAKVASVTERLDDSAGTPAGANLPGSTAPDKSAPPLPRYPRPAWRVAIIVGAFFALVSAAMVLMDPLSNLIGGYYMAGNLLLNAIIVFATVTGSVYALIRLWRWKKWASVGIAIGLPALLCATTVLLGNLARSIGPQSGDVRLYNPDRSYTFLYQDSSWDHYQVAPNGTICESMGGTIWLKGLKPVPMTEVRCGGATTSKWVESNYTR